MSQIASTDSSVRWHRANRVEEGTGQAACLLWCILWENTVCLSSRTASVKYHLPVSKQVKIAK